MAATSKPTYEELQAALQKSEASRQKLRANLTVLKEKALNTTALLQQHQDLQAERQRLQASLEGAQAACKAAEAGKRKAEDGMAVFKKQLASAQTEAGKASAQAAAAQRSVDKAIQALGGELTALRQLVEQRNSPEHAADAAVPTASAVHDANGREDSAVQSSVSEVQQLVSTLAQRVAQLEDALATQQAADKGTADVPAVLSLQQQMAVVRRDQQLMVSEMQRWKSFLGSFAALAGGSGRATAGPAASEPASELASGWQPVSPAELMMEASNAPALRGTMEGESVQRSGVLDAQLPGGCEDRDADGALGQREKAAPAHGSAEPRSPRKRVIALVAPGSSSPGKRRRTVDGPGDAGCAQPCSPASASTVSSLSEEADTAADVVRRALDMLDQEDGSEGGRVGTEAAAQLAAAIDDGTVPLSLVLAALQASIVHCSASEANSLAAADTYSKQLRACADEPSLSEGVSLQELKYLSVWAGTDKANVMRFATLLLCAHELALGLETSEQRGSIKMLASLQQRLSRAALADGTDQCSPQPPASQVCASAAAALLMRMRGDLQALREFVCDLVLAAQQDAASILPRLAAALDAWPQALPPAEQDGLSRVWDAAADTRGRQHSESEVAVVHTALQGLCAAQPAAVAKRGEEDADSESHAMLELAVLCLRHWGRRQWEWRDEGADDAVQRDRVSLGEAFALLRSMRR